MKSSAIVSVVAGAIGLAQAGPTPTEKQPPSKRASIPTVTVSGNAFWAGSDRFYVRGIDYQPGGSSDMKDPLADPKVCKRDLAKFQSLGVNTVRVYITDNSVGHDECMNAFADAGIYVIIDANNPLYSINRYDPGPSYNDKYLQSVFATIDAFIKYPNTLAFFSGNEVVNENISSTISARYVKATTRDMRQYIGNHGYRKVPVGYSAADVSQNRLQLAQYMNCGTDDERSDFFAFNDYSWCNTDFKTAGWDQKVKTFTDFGVPIFLSEYGCITNGRDFGEVAALMSSQMTSVYSGGLMFEYALGDNGFGIVKIDSSGGATEQPEFAKFKKALANSPAPSGSAGASSTTKAAACPAKDANWLIDTTLLPSLPEGAKQYLSKVAGTGPGLTGDGSQNAGGSSTSDANPGSGSSTGSPPKNGAGPTFGGPLDKTPLIVAGVALLFTMAGTFFL